MAGKNFKIGDLVWAKLKGYPPCTARVENPPKNQKNVKKAQHFLYFFESKKFAWVQDKWIGPHAEKEVTFCPNRKSVCVANDNIVGLDTQVPEMCSTRIKEETNSEEEETLKTSAQLSTKDDGKVPEPQEEKHSKVQNKEPKKRYLANSEVTHHLSPAKVQKVDNDCFSLLANVPSSTEHSRICKFEKKALIFPRKIPETSITPIKDPKQETSSILTEVPNVDSAIVVEREVVEPQEEKNAEVLMEDGPGFNHQSDLANHEFKNELEIISIPGSNTESSSVSVVHPCSDLVPTAAPNVLTPDRLGPPPGSPPFDIMTVSRKIASKNITATTKKLGFIGLGLMGRGIVKNLLNTGHDVTVWNRSPEKCVPFVSKVGAFQVSTPYDVVMRCDVVFCCVSDPVAVRAVVFGKNGVLEGVRNSAPECKGYVELTSIDPTTSKEVSEAIALAGGKYVEAPIIGSRQLADSGELCVLGAGDRDLFRSCESCFSAFCKRSYYMSDVVGTGSRMCLILSMLKGTVTCALAEAMALVDRCKLSQANFLELLDLLNFGCPLVTDKGKAMLQRSFVADTPLKYQQKDMNLALLVGHENSQPLPTSSAANEIYKHAKLMRCGDYDASSVYFSVKY